MCGSAKKNRTNIDWPHYFFQDVEMKGIRKDLFGVFHDPDSDVEVKVERYTLTSASGVEVQVSWEWQKKLIHIMLKWYSGVFNQAASMY